jgi:hypothetical protein
MYEVVVIGIESQCRIICTVGLLNITFQRACFRYCVGIAIQVRHETGEFAPTRR